jgi:hypothetical protein
MARKKIKKVKSCDCCNNIKAVELYDEPVTTSTAQTVDIELKPITNIKYRIFEIVPIDGGSWKRDITVTDNEEDACLICAALTVINRGVFTYEQFLYYPTKVDSETIVDVIIRLLFTDIRTGKEKQSFFGWNLND